MSVYLYINGSDRTSNLEMNTLVIKNQIQQRADTIQFRLLGGTAPAEWDDIGFYKGDTIAGFSGTTVTLDGNYQKNVEYFYPGQKLRIRIGDSDEETVEVLTYDESALEVELVAAPSGTVSVGDKIGEKMFGGVMLAPITESNGYASNIEYDCRGTDYSKLFDKKLISDTWADVDSRYIINDFLNTTVNYNLEFDSMDYANDAALQAVWVDSADADPATVDTANLIEGTSAASFDWTFSTGTARFTANSVAGGSSDFSDFTDAASGPPVSGYFSFWYKRKQTGNITTFNVRFGDTASSNALYAIALEEDTEWHFVKKNLSEYASVLGTPDWTAADYFRFIFVQTADGGIIIDDLRIVHESGFSPAEVQSTPDIDDFRAATAKPTGLMQDLAKTWEYVWFIDYERVIHFIPMESDPSPWNATVDNVDRLVTEIDASQVGNRIQISGGEEISDSAYTEVFEGDGVRKEWILKAKFSQLEIELEQGGTTLTAAVGTTTTNITFPSAHGLSDGDFITNRTRNAAREVTVVDPTNVTVDAVPSQASGDTIGFFDTAKTDGIEGIDDETSFDYMANSNEKSVRKTESEGYIAAGDFIKFSYRERVPIQLQYQDVASVNALKAMDLGDGIFDLDPITDSNIDSRALAISIAQAKVSEFSNPIISGSYTTELHGIKAGQIQTVTESNRGFADDYVIQTVTIKQRSGEFKDNFQSRVKFGTTLFGWIEFMQKLLAIKDRIGVNTDLIVATFVTANEVVESSEASQVAKDGGFKTASQAETVESSESNTVDTLATGTWQFEPSVGQTFETRFDLCDFG